MNNDCSFFHLLPVKVDLARHPKKPKNTVQSKIWPEFQVFLLLFQKKTLEIFQHFYILAQSPHGAKYSWICDNITTVYANLCVDTDFD